MRRLASVEMTECLLLFGGGDFVDYGLGGGPWVGGSGDGAANDEEVCAGFYGFGGCGGAGLIVGSCRGGFGFGRGAHAWRDDKKIATAGFANCAGFLNAGDNTIDAGGFGQLRELHYARFWRATDANFADGF